METVHVSAINGEYDVQIGQDVLAGWKRPREYAVVTDRNVFRYYGACFPQERYAAILEPGEPSKSMDCLGGILENMVSMGLNRDAVVVAFGGGVVGDIAGLAASMYKRGVTCVQVPTTLLAQVDSSVGGKVAVNLRGGKNLAGAFFQPSLVLADLRVLSTLPEREYAAGMAEIIKYAYIASRELFDALMKGNDDLAWIIRRCVEIKADFVQKDPLDMGERMKLNYGHTLGHAIETCAGYGQYLHGEAVAVGMVLAARIGERLGISPDGLEAGTRQLVERYGLPCEAPPELVAEAVRIVGRDKKVFDGRISLVLLDEIGHAVLHNVPVEEIAETLGV